MTFISYAQNFEDVMLWRALKHVGEGFYIDVGALSPEFDSVTRAFYERGWRGISVEPNPEYHRQLQEFRERDVNLCLALSDESGTGSINLIDNPGLSTLDDRIAQRHEKAGFTVEKLQVELATLDQVWEEHVPTGQDVHFLKIDVEGFEGRVIRGNDWSRHRPWIVVVEATVPMSQDETYANWEPTLLENDYVMAYADGLNRFYVAAEHDELREALRYPPNYFDEFKQHALVAVETELERARQRAREAEDKAREHWDQRLKERTEKEQVDKQLTDLRAACTDASAELEQSRTELEKLGQRAQEAESKAREHRDQKLKEHAEKEQVEKQLADLRTAYFDAMSELERSRAELEKLSQRAQEAEDKARKFRNLRLEERAEKDQVAKRLADLYAEYTEARAELKQLRQRVSASSTSEAQPQKTSRDGKSG